MMRMHRCGFFRPSRRRTRYGRRDMCNGAGQVSYNVGGVTERAACNVEGVTGRAACKIVHTVILWNKHRALQVVVERIFCEIKHAILISTM